MAQTSGVPEPVSALNRVRLVESGEPLVDLREAMPDLRVLRGTSVPWVRSTVAEMLAKVRTLLPEGFDIGLREAWRSLRRQKMIYDAYFEDLRKRHPEWGRAALRRQTNRFFAPYDQKAPPGHCTGGAVDVWLLRANGRRVDLRGKGERFASAPTFHPELPERILRMRLVLHDAMLGAGFSNCRDEWWHYSYGDAGWAVRTGRGACLYGLAELPEEVYGRADRLFASRFRVRR